MAEDAYRTLAGNTRAAIKASVPPAIIMLIGAAAISYVALGDPFLDEAVARNSPGSIWLTLLPNLVLYASCTLIAFSAWTRMVLRIPPLAWTDFVPQHLKAAGVWFLAWVVMPFAIGLAVSVVLMPIVVILLLAGAGPPDRWAADPPAAVAVLMAPLATAAVLLASARLVLRASLISGDLAQSAVAPIVLSHRARAGYAMVLAAMPVMVCGLLASQILRSVDWMLAMIGVINALLLTLIQGAVCANLIRAASAPETER
jgi:hypothetical protein